MRIGILVAGLVALAAVPAVAAAPENFDLRTTGDLVSICSVMPSDAVSSATAGFCHGYVVGVYRTLNEMQTAGSSARFFCQTGQTQSRIQAIDAFVTWANTRPQVLAKPPMDGIADYLAETYPCPEPAAATRGRRSVR